MRIRLFTAFASNNSGSYTIVGRFRDESEAAAAAERLKAVVLAHHAWLQQWGFEGPDPSAAESSPLTNFAREHGLHAARTERDGDWPQHTLRAPAVLAVGETLLVHAPHTPGLPAMLGEFVYTQGGRVDREFEWAHMPLAARFRWWPREDTAPGATERFVAELRVLVARLCEPDNHQTEHSVAPVWSLEDPRVQSLTVLLPDLAEGVRAVRALAETHGTRLELRLWECPANIEDPFELLRRAELVPASPPG